MVEMLMIGQLGLILVVFFGLRARQDFKYKNINRVIESHITLFTTQQGYISELFEKYALQKKTNDFLIGELKKHESQIDGLNKMVDDIKEYNEVFGKAVETDIENARNHIERVKDTTKSKLNELISRFNHMYKDEVSLSERVKKCEMTLNNEFIINEKYKPDVITEKEFSTKPKTTRKSRTVKTKTTKK